MPSLIAISKPVDAKAVETTPTASVELAILIISSTAPEANSGAIDEIATPSICARFDTPESLAATTLAFFTKAFALTGLPASGMPRSSVRKSV